MDGIDHDSGDEWLIVVAETGPGTHAAQSIVTHAHMALPGFEVQILVGVGGSRKDDIPLGSVVAADHVYMPYGGIFDPKDSSGRPREFPSDPGLVRICRKVCREERWPERIRDPLNGNPRTILTHLFERLPNGVRLAALGATVAVNRSADRSAFSPPLTPRVAELIVDRFLEFGDMQKHFFSQILDREPSERMAEKDRVAA